MALVNSSEVQEIYPLVIDGVTIDMTPFITSAHVLVSELLATSGLSNDRLKLIETYLAAHFALQTYERGGIIKQKSDDSEDVYAAWTAGAKEGFAVTRFGQQAMTLDTSGKLAAASTGKLKAKFRVVSTPVNGCI